MLIRTILFLFIILFVFEFSEVYADVYKCINTKTFEIRNPNNGNCFYGKSWQNINKIANWKIDIYNKLNLNLWQREVLATINNMECGREDGLCLNYYDAGPFQINRIHTEAFNYSKKLIQNKESHKLFEYQLKWTLDRFNRIEKQICYKYTNSFDKAYCQMKNHNGNVKLVNGKELRVLYANKGLAIMKEYSKYFNFNNYFNNGSIFAGNDFFGKSVENKVYTKNILNSDGTSIFKGIFGM